MEIHRRHDWVWGPEESQGWPYMLGNHQHTGRECSIKRGEYLELSCEEPRIEYLGLKCQAEEEKPVRQREKGSQRSVPGAKERGNFQLNIK